MPLKLPLCRNYSNNSLMLHTSRAGKSLKNFPFHPHWLHVHHSARCAKNYATLKINQNLTILLNLRYDSPIVHTNIHMANFATVTFEAVRCRRKTPSRKAPNPSWPKKAMWRRTVTQSDMGAIIVKYVIRWTRRSVGEKNAVGDVRGLMPHIINYSISSFKKRCAVGSRRYSILAN